jgi:hypothetical protein
MPHRNVPVGEEFALTAASSERPAEPAAPFGLDTPELM